MTKKTTYVSFLLDETGSMHEIKDDTVGGFNSYVETLQKSEDDIVFSLVSFNSNETRVRYVAEWIQDVTPLTADDYNPNAGTPLIDAAVKIIKATDEAVLDRGDEPNVVVVIQTDGQENVSVEYTQADLASLIKEKTAAGWQFMFLGAGLDAFDAAQRAGMHLDASNVVSYARNRSRQVFDSTAANISDFAASGDALSLSYSPMQREEVGDVYTERHLDKKAGSGRKTSPRSRRKGRSGSSTAEDYSLTKP